jgi:hypothetical protein
MMACLFSGMSPSSGDGAAGAFAHTAHARKAILAVGTEPFL